MVPEEAWEVVVPSAFYQRVNWQKHYRHFVDRMLQCPRLQTFSLHQQLFGEQH